MIRYTIETQTKVYYEPYYGIKDVAIIAMQWLSKGDRVEFTIYEYEVTLAVL